MKKGSKLLEKCIQSSVTFICPSVLCITAGLRVQTWKERTLRLSAPRWHCKCQCRAVCLLAQAPTCVVACPCCCGVSQLQESLACAYLQGGQPCMPCWLPRRASCTPCDPERSGLFLLEPYCANCCSMLVLVITATQHHARSRPGFDKKFPLYSEPPSLEKLHSPGKV